MIRPGDVYGFGCDGTPHCAIGVVTHVSKGTPFGWFYGPFAEGDLSAQLASLDVSSWVMRTKFGTVAIDDGSWELLTRGFDVAGMALPPFGTKMVSNKHPGMYSVEFPDPTDFYEIVREEWWPQDDPRLKGLARSGLAGSLFVEQYLLRLFVERGDVPPTPEMVAEAEWSFDPYVGPAAEAWVAGFNELDTKGQLQLIAETFAVDADGLTVDDCVRVLAAASVVAGVLKPGLVESSAPVVPRVDKRKFTPTKKLRKVGCAALALVTGQGSPWMEIMRERHSEVLAYDEVNKLNVTLWV